MLKVIFAAIIAVLSGYGVVAQSNILFGKFRREEFVYYTNLSNLLVFIYHVLLLISFAGKSGGFHDFLAESSVNFAVMACILVTFIVFHFVLAAAARKNGLHFKDITVRFWGNLCVHYFVPLLTFAEWLIVWDKSGLSFMSAVWWLVLPLAYFVFVIIRAHFLGEIKEIKKRYPYPFIDKDELGTEKLIRNVALILIMFFIMGILLVLIGRTVNFYSLFK